MLRREFLTTSAAAAGAALVSSSLSRAAEHAGHAAGQTDGRIYESPAEAIASPREELAYVVGVYAGTEVKKPDYLATIDLDPASKTYSQVVHRLPMPNVGDELHHFGWNACGSCHGERERRYLIVPGLASAAAFTSSTRPMPAQPKLHKVIEPDEVIGKTKLTAPHTVHCLADGRIMISMLGDEKRRRARRVPAARREVRDRRPLGSEPRSGMNYNYDFWYQPRHNVMVSSEWAAPNTVAARLQARRRQGRQVRPAPALLGLGERGRSRRAIDLGEKGLIPLEVRFHHNPDSTHGFVGAALSSVMWHWHKDGDEVEGRARSSRSSRAKSKGWPFPVPGLITDLVLSMDDRWLYFSNWLHGDVRQYDVSDPAKPKLDRPGLARRRDRQGAASSRGKKLAGGPQMLQLSLDGKRLYVTNSLFSSWDNQFYPQIAKQGSYHAADRLRHREGRPEAQRQVLRRFRQGAGRPGAGPRDAFPARRLHVGYLGVERNSAYQRLDSPPARARQSAAWLQHYPGQMRRRPTANGSSSAAGKNTKAKVAGEPAADRRHRCVLHRAAHSLLLLLRSGRRRQRSFTSRRRRSPSPGRWSRWP